MDDDYRASRGTSGPEGSTAETKFEALGHPIRALAQRYGGMMSLSPRQTNLIYFAITGMSRKEAAAYLGCSVKTVEGYWRRIYQKCGCCSDAEVVARFIQWFVLSGDEPRAVAYWTEKAVPAVAPCPVP